MARRKQTKGKCIYCSREMTKGGLSKHLQSCKQREAVITTANVGSGKEGTIYHLLIQDNWQGSYWLHLEVSGAATLKDLDSYLRAIWLECCGHMSEFTLGRRDREFSMKSNVGHMFTKGVELLHTYDFGTSSETKIKCIAMRIGKKTTPHPIVLMARNNPPESICADCGKPATMLCLECLYEEEDECTLCDEHAESHPHENYGEPVPIANSPRMGMCGYIGPADPPY